MLLMTWCCVGNFQSASSLPRPAWSSHQSQLLRGIPCFGCASVRRLFPLDRFQVLHQILQPDVCVRCGELLFLLQ
jgi:hypothetical protein